MLFLEMVLYRTRIPAAAAGWAAFIVMIEAGKEGAKVAAFRMWRSW